VRVRGEREGENKIALYSDEWKFEYTKRRTNLWVYTAKN
jgi:hypothetical protein